MKFLRAQLQHHVVVAYLALFVALGGSSYAAITVTGKNVRNSSLTGADVRNESVTGRDVRSLTSDDVTDGSLRGIDFAAGELPSGSAGPPGPKGDSGEKGEAGPPGGAATALWAVVLGSNGALVRGSGTESTTRLAPGQYRVVFDRDVSACAYVATAGNPSNSNTNPPRAFASVAPQTGSPSTVFIEMRDDAGYDVDSSFHLAVFC
jgi:hypothetical protein